MAGKFLGFIGKADTAKDPVCHMDVDKKKPGGGTHDYNGTTYYFCGPGCRVAFSKDPEGYLSGKKRVNM